MSQEHPGADRPTSDRPTSDRPTSDRPSSDRPTSDRPSSDRVVFDPELCGVSGPLEALTFEELVGALERVAARLAGGDLGIETAADLYEQAELLYGAAQERLAVVEARIERFTRRGPPSPR
jgi:exodeoxyribonuclease VII small subunit